MTHKIHIGKTLIAAILSLVMLVTIILPGLAATTTSSQVVQNAQNIYDKIKETYGGIGGYVRVLSNQKLSYQKTLYDAEYYNAVYDTVVDFGSTGMDLICAIVTGGASEALGAVKDAAIDQLIDGLTNDLPKLTLEEYIYTQAKAGSAQVNLSELMDIGFKIENECGGRVASVADAIRFIRVNQEIKMGFAALQMGRDLYYEQLNASPWDTLLAMFTKHKLGHLFDGLGGNTLEQYRQNLTTEKVYELLTLLIGSIDNRHFTTYMNSVIKISKETEALISYTVDDFGKKPASSSSTNAPEQASPQTPPSIQTVTRGNFYYHGSDYNEGHYEGEAINGVPNGWGKLVYDDFDDGKFYSLELDGVIIKAISYEGNFVNGYRTGYGTVTYEQGYKDVGHFQGMWEKDKVIFIGNRWHMTDSVEGYWPVTETAVSGIRATPEYGNWVSTKQTYSITYHANGGQNAPTGQTKTKDTALALSTDIPTRSGYSFLGWSTSASSVIVEYQPGDLYAANSNVALYAVWSRQTTRSARILSTTLETSAVNGAVLSVKYETEGYQTGEVWLTFVNNATGERAYRCAPSADGTTVSISIGDRLVPGQTYKVFFTDQNDKNIMTGGAYAYFTYLRMDNAFTYSTPSLWARDSIVRAFDMGLLPDYLRMNYAAPATRMDFVRLAYAVIERQCGSIPELLYKRGIVCDPQTSPELGFTDVPQYCGYDGYDQYRVAALRALGIVKGEGNGRFEPNRAITRQEAAALLNRVYSFLKWGSVQGYSFAGSTDNLYYDNADISGWAFSDVYNMRAVGVMNGVGNNRFAPKAAYTVEGFIATFIRILDQID